MKKKIPNTNHAIKRYRDKAIKNQKKAKDSLESINLMLPTEYQIKITDDFWVSLARIEESIGKFRDDYWSKDNE